MRGVTGVVLLVGVFAASAARAQDGDTFELSGGLFDGRGTLRLEHPHLADPGAFYVGAGVSYADDPVVAVDEAGVETSIVSSQLGARLAAGVTIAEPVRVDLRMPAYPVNGVVGAEGFALGDLRIGATVAALDYDDEGVALSFGPFLDLPTGDNAAFTGGTFDTGVVAAAGGQTGAFGWTTNAGFTVGQTTALGDLDLGNAALVGAGCSVEAAPGFRIGAELGGQIGLGTGSTSDTSPLEWDGYLSYAQPTGIVGALAFGTGVVAGVGAPDFRVTAAIAYHYRGGPPDADRDGVADVADACINEPEDADGFKDEDGCPEADNDEDGLADAVDPCPNQAEDVDGFRDEDGCPDVDNDGDSIVDADDACPDQAGLATTGGCPDRDGDGLGDAEDLCPDVAGTRAQRGCPDRDGDGFFDADDACPDWAGPKETKGCPDRDKDLVPDFRDKCPDVPADPQADPARSDGCPSRVVVTRDKIVIKEKVFFDTGKATIQARSFGLLDDVAAAFAQNPDILKVEVAGHTDSQGADAANLTLSQKRADAVVSYLINKGIGPERLSPVGFGEAKPIASNDTADGRAENRRVEFTILDQKEGGP